MKFNKSNISVCVIGLGFVGLTLAAIMAELGFNVHGIERKKFIINKLKKKESHFFEPKLNNLLSKIITKKKLTFSKNFPKKKINTYIITVGTPLNENKSIITKHIKETCEQISKRLNNGDIVILRSTVKVGSTRNIALPILKKSKKIFHLAYCPERAVEGAALKELKKLPQVIGVLDKKSLPLIKSIFKKITNKIVQASSLETAEMIKLIDNSSRDVFFAYANEIARVCDSLGLSASEIISSGKLGYKRTDIAKPGLVGGPCLHKDPYIFSESLKKYNIKPEITLTARKINERQPSEIVKFIYKKFKKINKNKNLNITILGLAFKGFPITDDLRGSMSITLIKKLREKFKKSKFYGFDPFVQNQKIKEVGIKPTNSINNAFKNKDLVIIANNNKYFSELDIEKYSKLLNNKSIIYDVWNLFDKNILINRDNTDYYSLGSQSI